MRRINCFKVRPPTPVEGISADPPQSPRLSLSSNPAAEESWATPLHKLAEEKIATDTFSCDRRLYGENSPTSRASYASGANASCMSLLSPRPPSQVVNNAALQKSNDTSTDVVQPNPPTDFFSLSEQERKMFDELIKIRTVRKEIEQSVDDIASYMAAAKISHKPKPQICLWGAKLRDRFCPGSIPMVTDRNTLVRVSVQTALQKSTNELHTSEEELFNLKQNPYYLQLAIDVNREAFEINNRKQQEFIAAALPKDQ